MALGWVAGLLIGPVHREETSLVVASSPETIWGVLTDLDGMPNWRRDVVGVERLPAEAGMARWREQRRDGTPVVFEWTEAVPMQRLVIRRAGGGRAWVYRIQRVGDGTRLAVTEERRIGNPALRTFVTIFGSGRGRIEAFAEDLAARLAAHRRRLAAD